MESSKIQLNNSQLTAVNSLKKFMTSSKYYDFLLLGQAGSGKTTVIVNAFNSISIPQKKEDWAQFPEDKLPLTFTRVLNYRVPNYRVPNDGVDDRVVPNDVVDGVDRVLDRVVPNYVVDSVLDSVVPNDVVDGVDRVNSDNVGERFHDELINKIANRHPNKYNIIFCAFTNKATQVLKCISQKFSVEFNAEFMTIHKLLALEIKHLLDISEIDFKFDKSKIDYLKNYDVIIFDECSTISEKLFKYINLAREIIEFKYGRKLKFIYLGDYWQLPPVSEDNSVIFEHANYSGWPVIKLDKNVRFLNSEMQNINKRMLDIIPFIQAEKIDNFVIEYPYNMIKKGLNYIKLYELYDKYINTWKNLTNDVVILSYSKKNCEQLNFSIQDCLDEVNNRNVPKERKLERFYPGDRCCIESPIEIHEIITVEQETDYQPGDSVQNMILQTNHLNKEKNIVTLGKYTGENIYNGEIFDICQVEDVYIKLDINKYDFMPKYFEGQILECCRVKEPGNKFKIIFIKVADISDMQYHLKKNMKRNMYLLVMTEFIKKIAYLTYGYCLSIYKSQGSEWDTVFININSIKWSITGKGDTVDIKKKIQLFKTTYTAATRCSNKLYVIY